MAKIDDLMNAASRNAVAKANFYNPTVEDDYDYQSSRPYAGPKLPDSFHEVLRPDAEFTPTDEDSADPVPGVNLSDVLLQRLLLNSPEAREGVDSLKGQVKSLDMSDPAYRSIIENTIRKQRGPEKRS